MAIAAFKLLISALVLFCRCDADEWDQSLRVEGKCFLFVNIAKKWDEALASCVTLGGTLASITSQEQFDKIVNYLPDPTESYWIGGRNSGGGQPFFWTEDNTTPAAIASDWWEPSYPFSYSNYSCVDIYNNKLYNDHCDSRLFYLCMKSDATSSAPITTEEPITPGETTTMKATDTTTKKQKKICKKG